MQIYVYIHIFVCVRITKLYRWDISVELLNPQAVPDASDAKRGVHGVLGAAKPLFGQIRTGRR